MAIITSYDDYVLLQQWVSGLACSKIAEQVSLMNYLLTYLT